MAKYIEEQVALFDQRDLGTRTRLRATSLPPTTQPPTAPLTCALLVYVGVGNGITNHRRIDGKDGVAGSIRARLRAAGDRATARQVAALRRPPVSAWATNQLAHAAPNAVAELLDAGAALRQAQQDALAGQPGAARQLRTATAHLRAAITRLSQRAESLLSRAGHATSDANLSRLAATLQAAATGDETTRAAWPRDGSRGPWIRRASASTLVGLRGASRPRRRGPLSAGGPGRPGGCAA